VRWNTSGELNANAAHRTDGGPSGKQSWNMNDMTARRSLAAALLLGAVGAAVVVLASMHPLERAATDSDPASASSPKGVASAKATEPDLSGRKRTGKASYYAQKFAGRTMADGTGMDPHGDNAASKTLPLGTTAKVTNLETGKSAVVTIQDRGPFVKGRIIDVSPATAHAIGLDRQDGVADVAVTPISVPLPDGRVKQGDEPR
jgi:rare lipoprotein A